MSSQSKISQISDSAVNCEALFKRNHVSHVYVLNYMRKMTSDKLSGRTLDIRSSSSVGLGHIKKLLGVKFPQKNCIQWPAAEVTGGHHRP